MLIQFVVRRKNVQRLLAGHYVVSPTAANTACGTTSAWMVCTHYESLVCGCGFSGSCRMRDYYRRSREALYRTHVYPAHLLKCRGGVCTMTTDRVQMLVWLSCRTQAYWGQRFFHRFIIRSDSVSLSVRQKVWEQKDSI